MGTTRPMKFLSRWGHEYGVNEYQWEIFKAAWDQGYLEPKKRVELADLAAQFGVSKSRISFVISKVRWMILREWMEKNG